ncbi:MAG TPA: PASTA domain-containing protein [Candidatus Syntrophosphaera sp.]|nr:PASTA domain-containing protein [Candidatus Cloacimonadota bacterium]HOR02776.1 PASTA domain-containing protein [Candidatus Syntrophosphaera sp.]HOG31189.1 PASTA domain-containing protein [Candidatus Cloacimonadota bacterium]HOU72289.1 PASTA domain-containing protein [Candidatus Syntrophosphaera sp.]HQG94384.1 PASTA domain-containing protein [Candidatus Syntrophosphaera sp.]
MASEISKKFWLTVGIGAGIIFLSAFITSQIIFPIIFREPKQIEVPNLVGISSAAARQTLSALGLHAVVKDSIWSETERIDTVLEQNPAGGALIKPEGTVYLRVSRGTRKVGVPSVVGLSYQEAYYTLVNAGLKGVVADSLYSDSYAPNTVIRCIPGVGSKIELGAVVRMYMSRGPEPVIQGGAFADTTLQYETPFENW